ncbi:hypothetical protein BRPE64_DCDS09800 (plasmid) [Caballeronia insecticola]|uniref:Uncharacterized protein n=1 Tax=Caballeronia insecticola TaxID=758793 RepID=R4X442_9BURK|nr:hypothetical protein BRPE64_DCDS09800 [Caballeronia insecticola]
MLAVSDYAFGNDTGSDAPFAGAKKLRRTGLIGDVNAREPDACDGS